METIDAPTDVGTVAEVCERIGADAPSERTIQRWVKAQRIRAYRLTVGGRVVSGVSEAEVRAFIRPAATRDDTEPTPTESAVAGWTDAREALVVARDEHRAQVELLANAHEREVVRLTESTTREVERLDMTRRDAVRWGRGSILVAIGTLVAAGILVVQERDRAANAQLEAVRSDVEAARSALPAFERLAIDLASMSERAARAESRAESAERREHELRRDVGLAVEAMTDVVVSMLVGKGK